MGNATKNRNKLKVRDYSMFMSAQMTKAAVSMDTVLFEKWLRLVVRLRAKNGDARAIEMLHMAELDIVGPEEAMI